MANEWEKVVNILKEEITRNRKEIKSAIEASESKLLLKIEELNHRINQLESENSTLSEKVEVLEKITKKNNIIVYGLENLEDISPTSICRQLKNLLDVQISEADFNNIYRLKTQGKKPLKIEFISYFKKVEVLRNCNKLKNSGVTITNDFTYKQRCYNKILRNHLNKARENPSNQSYIKGNKLYINNRGYTVEELEENEQSHTEDRTVNSAPSTPTIRNLGRELQNLSSTEEKEPEHQLQNSKIGVSSGVTEKPKKTPIKINPPKKTSKTAVHPITERTKRLRSGSGSSERL